MELKDNMLTKATASIRETMERLNRNVVQIVIVVDRKKRILGTVTDGDIRRGILRNLSLDERVEKIMNPRPTVLPSNTPDDRILQVMEESKKKQIPLINEKGVIVGLKVIDEIIRAPRRSNYVVIMAGGEGRRLRPLTEEMPKPMLPVGQQPILQTIIDSLRQNGFCNIVISLYYKSHVIQDYFGNGEEFGVNISYVKEKKPLGTAGALSLLPAREINAPFLVMNADLLTTVNFGGLLDAHIKESNALTVCVKEHIIQIPYGVVSIDGNVILDLVEKPQKKVFINAGIYVVSPELLKLVPASECFNMTDLVKKALAKRKKVACFPIHEYWLDIGKLDDYYKAKDDFLNIFEEKK